MTVLHGVEFFKEYEYEVRRDGDIYIAGATNARFKPRGAGQFYMDIYLDKVIEEIPGKSWTPNCLVQKCSDSVVESSAGKFWNSKILMPYEKDPRPVTSRQFYVKNITVPGVNFNFADFVECLNEHLLTREKSYMRQEDIEKFFHSLFVYYGSISKEIRDDILEKK